MPRLFRRMWKQNLARMVVGSERPRLPAFGRWATIISLMKIGEGGYLPRDIRTSRILLAWPRVR